MKIIIHSKRRNADCNGFSIKKTKLHLNYCHMTSSHQRCSIKGVFLLILQNLQEHLFYRTTLDGRFFHAMMSSPVSLKLVQTLMSIASPATKIW